MSQPEEERKREGPAFEVVVKTTCGGCRWHGYSMAGEHFTCEEPSLVERFGVSQWINLGDLEDKTPSWCPYLVRRSDLVPLQFARRLNV